MVLKKLYVFLTLIILCGSINAAITLPSIFTDHMVLQRDMPVKIWGRAGNNETVKLSFNHQTVTTRSMVNGEWSIVLHPMHWGGPFDLTIISANEKKILHDILIGDVWICSGQSNMEFPVSGWTKVKDAEKEIAAANHPVIRLFTAEKATSFNPEPDVKGGQWMVCTPQNIPSFSAVAYFFGRKINADMKIPVGLISTNWGGTNIQAWTSWETIAAMNDYKHLDKAKTEALFASQDVRSKAYHDALQHDPGSIEKWYRNDDIQGWKKILMPALWESSVIGNTDGIIWFKKNFDLSTPPPYQNIILSLGPIDDADSTYINGVLAGSDNVWNKDRTYTINPSLLHEGRNTITIKMTDNSAQGGMSGKPEQVYISIAGNKIPLAGEWAYKPAVQSSGFNLVETGPNAFPSQLYNAMMAPFTNFKIKGAIWYQGEANVSEAAHYKKLFPALIKDWRKHWGYDFPFIWVQLANYMKKETEPAASEWAELREAQHQTLALPNTAEAVSIDIGEAGDIHPKNKQDVGLRLAFAAEKIAYKKNILYSGPLLTRMIIQQNKAILRFTNTGGGLVAKDAVLTGFEIAGSDQQFVWADARISGNTVIVESRQVHNPVAVRYAWANNPDAGLYNKAGLPASPFRTDKWILSTSGNRIYKHTAADKQAISR